MINRDKIEINEESIWQLNNPTLTIRGVMQIIIAVLIGILLACVFLS